MKKSNFPYLVFLFMNIAIAISSYFYPVTRDEFYYLDQINIPSPFLEYFNSYHFGNPRIGQFFANIISRNKFLEVIFGVLLFNSFIFVLFLNIYRKFPDLKQKDELLKFLWLSSFLVLFINYFGEMFYYTPYSTNYTFTHIFYLLYIFLISEFYLVGNEKYLEKLPYFAILIFGVFLGMSNEHVPPVLVAVSFLFAFIYFLKTKKLPNLKLILFPLSIMVGYALLYFAPANKIKQKVVGKSVLDIQFLDYVRNFVKIIKTYFYYNRELLVVLVLVIFAMVIWNRKIKIMFSREKLLFWFALFVLPLMIVAVSPLLGTRLLFFSTCILLIILYQIMIALFEFKKMRSYREIMYGFLFLFFGMSIIITFKANQNYEMVISEIEKKSTDTKAIELDHHLNYFTIGIGSYLNRKIFLESGEDYIDSDASHDNAVEKNIKDHFQLQSIKQK